MLQQVSVFCFTNKDNGLYIMYLVHLDLYRQSILATVFGEQEVALAVGLRPSLQFKPLTDVYNECTEQCMVIIFS